MTILAPLTEKELLLKYKIWPVHPLPLHDELLSSWLIRTAYANRFKVQDFCSLYFGRNKQIWNRDIDHFSPKWIIQILSEYFRYGIPIENLTLKAYQDIVFEECNMNSTRGILPIGIYHRNRTTYGLQYCPLCLKEDKQPYYRKKWRLAYLTMCVKHKIYLHNKCMSCRSPVMPHRIDMTHKTYLREDISLRTCSTCYQDLSAMDIIKVQNEYELELAIKFLKCIEDGFTSISSNQNLYSNQFFEGIRTLAHGVARVERINTKSILYQHKKFILERNSLEQRVEVMKIVGWLIQDWPINFQSYLKIIKQPYSTFISKNTNSYAPFWVYHEALLL